MKRSPLFHVLCLVALFVSAFGSSALATSAALRTFDAPVPPTPEPSPSVDPPRPAPVLSLETFADPATVAPDEITRLYWRLLNDSDASGPATALIAHLPKGLHVLQKSVRELLQYDPNEHSITWQAADIPAHTTQEASVALRVTGLREGDVVDITTELRVASEPEAHTSRTAITIGAEAPEVVSSTPGNSVTARAASRLSASRKPPRTPPPTTSRRTTRSPWRAGRPGSPSTTASTASACSCVCRPVAELSARRPPRQHRSGAGRQRRACRQQSAAL